MKFKKTGPEVMHLYRPGKRKPRVGRCGLCRRKDLEADGAFHYAPCGLPCAGGVLPPKAREREDAPDGIHSRAKCPRCRKEASG